MKRFITYILSLFLTFTLCVSRAEKNKELYNNGCIKLKQGDYVTALQQFSQIVDSINIHTEDDNELYVAALNKIAFISILNSNYVKAYAALLQALDSPSNSQSPISHLYLAIICNYYRDVSTEEQNLRAAMANSNDLTQQETKNLIFINFAGFFNEHNRLKEIESVIRNFIDNSTLNGTTFDQYTLLTAKAYLAIIEGKNSEALNMLKMAANIVEKDSEEQNAYLSAMFEIALFYMNQEDYEKAISQLYKCLELAEKYHFKVFIPIGYEYLSKCYELQGDREQQIHFRQKLINLRDSTLSLSTFREIKDMQYDFKAKQYQKDLDTITLKSHYYRLFLFLAIAMVIICVIFTFLLLKKTKSLKKAYIALYERNRELDSQEKKLEAAVPKHEVESESRTALHKPLRDAFEHGTLWLQQDFTLAMLAKELNTNTTYLSTAVNEIYGKSFRSLVNEKRIRTACEMLSQDEKYGHLTIEAIASNCGFKTASHFSSVFKSVTGLSPATYREIDKLKKQTNKTV